MTFCPEERRSIVTASDAPIVLGVSPHHDATWLYAYKLGLIEDSDNDVKAMGRRLEPVILGLLRERYPKLSIDSNRDLHMEDRLGATPDGFAWAKDGDYSHVVEAKAAMWLTPTDWGSGPPPQFIAQCQHQMHVCGVDRALLGCLISAGTRGLLFRSAEMFRNESFIKGMIQKESEFLDRVEGKLGPPVPLGTDKDSTLKALAAVYPIAMPEYVHLPEEAAVEWTELERCRKEMLALRSKDKRIRIQFYAAIGRASLGLLPDGRAIHAKVTRNKNTGKVSRKLRLFRPGDTL